MNWKRFAMYALAGVLAGGAAFASHFGQETAAAMLLFLAGSAVGNQTRTIQ